jgi:hypothetical protein
MQKGIKLWEYVLKTLFSPSILLAFKKYSREYILMKMARLNSVLPYLQVRLEAGNCRNMPEQAGTVLVRQSPERSKATISRCLYNHGYLLYLRRACA